MKLTKVRVKNFRSVEDSGEFDVSALTCLVGKNEAGKTAILSALYGLRSFRPFQYEQSRDYPRRYLASFDKRHLDGKSEVVRTWWALDEEDTKAVEEKFGAGVLSSSEIEIWYGINYESKYWNVQTDEQIYLNHVIGKHKLNAAEMAGVKTAKDIKSAIASLNSSDSLTDKQRAVLAEIESLRESRLSLAVIDLLNERMPKFFYTSHYERMSGEISPAKLVSDKDNGNVSIGDQIFLDFLEYAGTSVEELEEATKYEDLKAKCEGASNEITDEIFTFGVKAKHFLCKLREVRASLMIRRPSIRARFLKFVSSTITTALRYRCQTEVQALYGFSHFWPNSSNCVKLLEV